MAEPQTVIRLDARAVAELLRGRNGMVAQHLAIVATQVQAEARRRVGKDTRRLEHSIVKRFVMRPDGPTVEVGSTEKHALFHHEGTRPHEILPKQASVLRFPVSKGSSVFIFARSVQHPGTKPNKFLTEALEAVLATGGNQ